jgi:hypothetical protein
MLLGVRSIRSWQSDVLSSSGPAIKRERARRLQHERRCRNGRLAASGSRKRWVSSRRDRRLAIDEATAPRHPLTPWQETRTRARRGEEKSQEEEEAMASGQPKTRTLYSLFSKVPVSRPMISSAGEEAFQGLLSDFIGFTSDFNDRVALGQSKNARKERSPAHVLSDSGCLDYKATSQLRCYTILKKPT